MSERAYRVSDPATGVALAEVPDLQAADVNRVVSRAAQAALEWATVSPLERARAVRRIAQIVRTHAEDLAVLDARNAGHPIVTMRVDVALAADQLDLFADLGASGLGGETYPGEADHLSYTVREPYGVVARIVAFNHPLMFAASKLGAPLVAGNAVVLKPAEPTPLSALRLVELIAGELPSGLVGVVTGAGPASGRALVAHPEVRRIGFIGSAATGRAIQRDAAERSVKAVTLELGGKNPMLALPDVPPERVAAAAVDGMNFRGTAGQSCGSTSRLLVHTSRAAAVLAALRERVGAIRVGLPLDETTEMGSLIGEGHRQRVIGVISRARAAGATVVAGGGAPSAPDLAGGAYVEPTVLGDVTPHMAIARDEIFGPVLSVLTYRDEDEAVRIANATPYGLTASVWSADVGRAQLIARRLQAGYVWVNTSSRHFAGAPFGGVKESGLGREEGLEELQSYTETKAVHVALAALGPGEGSRADEQ